jgi:hypothetical protein
VILAACDQIDQMMSPLSQETIDAVEADIVAEYQARGARNVEAALVRRSSSTAEGYVRFDDRVVVENRVAWAPYRIVPVYGWRDTSHTCLLQMSIETEEIVWNCRP